MQTCTKDEPYQNKGFCCVSDYVLLTGATGLLGRYLLRDLLLKDVRVAVLVRCGRRETVEQRIEGILQRWESELSRALPRPVCLEGDVCRVGFGLDDADRQWVAEHCRSLIHSAASLDFHADSSGEPWRTNVEGTRNMLELCRETGLGDLHYISTAYVCGLREGVIREDELDFGQEFRNDYEKTKLVAESLVRQADFLDSLTVYRPAVITGDSRTGYTNTYHGLYMYLKLMSVLVWNTPPGPDGVRHTPVRLNMTGNEPRNIVPVNWASEVIATLFCTPAAHGKTFHLAPEHPLTPRETIEAGYKYFNSRGVEFCGPSRAIEPASEMDRDAHDNMGIYKEYEISDPLFDTTNLKTYAGHLPCPRIDEAMLHRFWKYAEEDRWGKRRQPQPVTPFRMADYLSQLVERDDFESFGSRDDETTVALDVRGPGGGQWSLVLDGDRLTHVAQGLNGACSARLGLSSAEFLRLLQEDNPEQIREQLSRYMVVCQEDQTGLEAAIARAFFPARRAGVFANNAALSGLQDFVQQSEMS